MLHLKEYREGLALAATETQQVGDAEAGKGLESLSLAKARYVLETLAPLAVDSNASETPSSEAVEHVRNEQSCQCCKHHEDVEKSLREQLHRQSSKLREVSTLVQKCLEEAERIMSLEAGKEQPAKEVEDHQAAPTQAPTLGPCSTESFDSQSPPATNPLEFTPVTPTDWRLDPPPPAPLLPTRPSDVLLRNVSYQYAPSEGVRQSLTTPDVSVPPTNARFWLFPANDDFAHQQRVVEGTKRQESVGARDEDFPKGTHHQRLPSRCRTPPREWAHRSGQRVHPAAGMWLQNRRSASTSRQPNAFASDAVCRSVTDHSMRYASPRAASSPRHLAARRPPTPPRNRSRSPLDEGRRHLAQRPKYRPEWDITKVFPGGLRDLHAPAESTKQPNFRPISPVNLPLTDGRPPRQKRAGGIQKRGKAYCGDCGCRRRDVSPSRRVRWDDDE